MGQGDFMTKRRDLILRLAVASYPWYRDGGALRDTWIVRLVSDADALLAACNTLEAPPQPERVCVWTEIDEGSRIYDICENDIEFHLGTDLDLAPFCPYCGGRVEVKP